MSSPISNLEMYLFLQRAYYTIKRERAAIHFWREFSRVTCCLFSRSDNARANVILAAETMMCDC